VYFKENSSLHIWSADHVGLSFTWFQHLHEKSENCRIKAAEEHFLAGNNNNQAAPYLLICTPLILLPLPALPSSTTETTIRQSQSDIMLLSPTSASEQKSLSAHISQNEKTITSDLQPRLGSSGHSKELGGNTDYAMTNEKFGDEI